MNPRNVELGKLDRRVVHRLINASGWPATPRVPTRSGWWWILDRLGDQLEENR